MHVAFLGNAALASTASRGCRLFGNAGKDERRIGLASSVHVNHERQGVVLHNDLGGGFVGCLRSRSCDGGDRLSGEAHDRVLGGSGAGVALDSGAEEQLDDMHAFYARMALCRGGVHGKDFGMGHRGIDKAGVEHARQLNVGGIAGTPADFGMAIPALGRLSNVVEIFVDGQDRRLGGRDGSLFLMQGIAGNADRHGDGFGRGISGVGAGEHVGNGMRGIGRHDRFLLRLARGLAGCVERGGKNVEVGAAAAEIAGDRVANLGLGRMRIFRAARRSS